LRTALLAEARDAGPTLLGSLDDLLWFIFPLGENPNYEPDREDSIAGLAAAAGRPALEMMYDALIDHDGKELFYQPLGFYQSYDFSYFHETLQHPNIVFGLSDGGAHCGLIADAGMPSFILTHWARDRTKGDKLPLPFLVRKLTHDTAAAYDINDRGLLKPGYLADINVIDFDNLRLHRPEAIYDLPTGGKRLVQKVDGYRQIVKSGQVIFEDGEHTGALPGKLIRGGQ
jgi:N-acyl-D-aspartate/D-glutamate deacylase